MASKSLEVKYVYRHAGLACLGTTLTTAVARHFLSVTGELGGEIGEIPRVFFLKLPKRVKKKGIKG